MAQTKTRSSRSSSASSRSANKGSSNSAKSSGGSSRSSASSRTSKGTSQSRSSKSTQSKSTQNRRSSPKSGGGQSTGGQTGQPKSTIGTIAEKAKGPALAGGAALLGIAGGVAMTRKRKRSSVLGRIPTPKLKAPSLPKSDAVVKAVSQAAGQVADGSHRVGEVAAQVQRASEAINGSRSDSDD